jgi:4-hydroxy-tetrahydrodipicolinate synthase
VSGILVTPYGANGGVEPDKLRPIVDRAIEAGVHVLVVNGNTGEYYSLTPLEAETMAAAAARLVAKRVPLLGGVGRSVREAAGLAAIYRDLGLDGVLVHQPPDPFASPRGVTDYVRAISEAAEGMPLILYLRNDGIGLDAILGLCDLQGVVAVKWACPTPTRLAEAIRRRPDIVWICGLAEIWASPFAAVGATGFTSGLMNVWPERSVDIQRALQAADFAAARHLIDQIVAFEDIRAEELNGTNVTVVKAALEMVGLGCGPTRPPSSWPLTDHQQQRLRELLSSWSVVDGGAPRSASAVI